MLLALTEMKKQGSALVAVEFSGKTFSNA